MTKDELRSAVKEKIKYIGVNKGTSGGWVDEIIDPVADSIIGSVSQYNIEMMLEIDKAFTAWEKLLLERLEQQLPKQDMVTFLTMREQQGANVRNSITNTRNFIMRKVKEKAEL
jgi:hypothetical protein